MRYANDPPVHLGQVNLKDTAQHIWWSIAGHDPCFSLEFGVKWSLPINLRMPVDLAGHKRGHVGRYFSVRDETVRRHV